MDSRVTSFETHLVVRENLCRFDLEVVQINFSSILPKQLTREIGRKLDRLKGCLRENNNVCRLPCYREVAQLQANIEDTTDPTNDFTV